MSNDEKTIRRLRSWNERHKREKAELREALEQERAAVARAVAEWTGVEQERNEARSRVAELEGDLASVERLRDQYRKEAKEQSELRRTAEREKNNARTEYTHMRDNFVLVHRDDARLIDAILRDVLSEVKDTREAVPALLFVPRLRNLIVLFAEDSDNAPL